MFLGDIVDQFLDRYGLTYAGTAEQADLTALGVRCEQVDNLDASLQDFSLRRQLVKGRSCAVDWILLSCTDWFTVINRIAQYVKYPAECNIANGNGNRSSLIYRIHAADQSVRGGHGDTTNQIVAQMIGHFQGQLFIASMLCAGSDFDCIENFRQLSALKLNVDNRTHNAYYASYVHLCFPP
ncbi:hypothetical protein D3C71_1233090 [compost metagenome]